MSARRGVGYVLFSWQEIVQEMAKPFLSSSKTRLLYKLLLKYFIALGFCGRDAQFLVNGFEKIVIIMDLQNENIQLLSRFFCVYQKLGGGPGVGKCLNSGPYKIC